MTTYRAYRIDDRRRIRSAEWLEAPSDNAAIDQAGELCDDTSSVIELWQAARLVEEVDCPEDEDK